MRRGKALRRRLAPCTAQQPADCINHSRHSILLWAPWKAAHGTWSETQTVIWKGKTRWGGLSTNYIWYSWGKKAIFQGLPSLQVAVPGWPPGRWIRPFGSWLFFGRLWIARSPHEDPGKASFPSWTSVGRIGDRWLLRSVPAGFQHTRFLQLSLTYLHGQLLCTAALLLLRHHSIDRTKKSFLSVNFWFGNILLICFLSEKTETNWRSTFKKKLASIKFPKIHWTGIFLPLLTYINASCLW